LLDNNEALKEPIQYITSAKPVYQNRQYNNSLTAFVIVNIVNKKCILVKNFQNPDVQFQNRLQLYICLLDFQLPSNITSGYLNIAKLHLYDRHIGILNGLQTTDAKCIHTINTCMLQQKCNGEHCY